MKPRGQPEQATSEKQRIEPTNYKGVRLRKWGKWVSEIRLPNSRERIWLGSYDTPEKAARAFDAALYCLRGHGAKFNFPEDPPNIPGGRSLGPQEIQAVAARYANEKSSSASNNNSDNNASSSFSSNVKVDNFTTAEAEMDWSFLGMLDSNPNNGNYGFDQGGTDFEPFNSIGIDNNMVTSDYYPPTPLPPQESVVMDYSDNIIGEAQMNENDIDDAYSGLWSF